jgi:oxygen-dependent protoporphyrinogen oxidase
MTTVVVGGGISGLACAHALKKRGERVLLLEASERVGGVIRSEQVDGFLLEAGPNSLLDREPAMRALVEELGLTVRPAAPAVKKRFVYTRGALRAVPSSPPAFLKSDVLPFGAKARAVAELFSRRGPGGEESLGDFARRHLGREATSVLVDAMQSGIFAGDPERLSVGAVFPQLVKMEREHRSLILALIRAEKARRRAPAKTDLTGGTYSFEGGLESLVRALEARLGDAVHRRVALQSLRREGQTWRLSVLRETVQETLEADAVVLATPAYVSADVVRPLDAELASELGGIEHAPVAVVNLGYARADAAGVPEGFGFLVPEREGRKLLGCIFASHAFPHRAPADGLLLTCMVGGARHPERVALDEAALTALAREELAMTLGVTAPPRLVRVSRWTHGIPQYNLGHLARLERMEARLAKLPGLHLTGNALRGVGMNDCVREASALAGRIVPVKA